MRLGWIDQTGKTIPTSNVTPEPNKPNEGKTTQGNRAIQVELEEHEKLAESLTDLLYKKSQIAALNQSTWLNLSFLWNWLKKKPSVGPSYIEKEIFRQALLEVLQEHLPDAEKLTPNDTIDDIIRKIPYLDFYSPAQYRLTQVAESAKLKSSTATFQEFKNELENLFVQAQERTTGVYKRNAKGMSFLVGLLVAFGVNADTLYMLNALGKNPTLTANLATAAEKVVNNNNADFKAFQDCMSKNAQDTTKCPKELASFQNSVKQAMDSQLAGASLAEIITWDKLPQNPNQELTAQFTGFVQEYDSCLRPIFKESDPKKRTEITTRCTGEFDKNIKNISSSVKTPIDTGNQCLERAKQETEPNRWAAAVERCSTDLQNQFIPNDPKTNWTLWKVLGLLVSAIAIAMGAPFWFEMLGKIINVRNAGKPADSPK
jgi:hypothetical protein